MHNNFEDNFDEVAVQVEPSMEIVRLDAGICVRAPSSPFDDVAAPDGVDTQKEGRVDATALTIAKGSNDECVSDGTQKLTDGSRSSHGTTCLHSFHSFHCGSHDGKRKMAKC